MSPHVGATEEHGGRDTGSSRNMPEWRSSRGREGPVNSSVLTNIRALGKRRHSRMSCDVMGARSC